MPQFSIQVRVHLQSWQLTLISPWFLNIDPVGIGFSSHEWMGHISILFIFASILVQTLCYHSSSSTHFINKYVLIVCKCGEYVYEWHLIIFDPPIIYVFIVPLHHFFFSISNDLHILHCFLNVICKEEEIWVVGLPLIYRILITNNSI
jgi:hypothetical protein